MGTRFEDSKGRIDVYRFDPDDIVVDETLQGRWGSTDVTALAASIHAEGQLQPVGIRKDANGKAVLTYGFRRLQAIKLLKQQYPGESWAVLAKNHSVNDEAAFRQNLAENISRKDLSPVDLAHAVAIWKNKFHKKESEIAELMGKTNQWVTTMNRIIALPEDLLQQVHAGEVSVDAAINLAKMSSKTRADLVRNIKEAQAPKTQTNGNGKRKQADITKGDVAAAARKMIQDDPWEAPELGAAAEMTMAEFKAFLKKHGEVSPVRKILRLIEGTISEAEFLDTFYKLSEV